MVYQICTGKSYLSPIIKIPQRENFCKRFCCFFILHCKYFPAIMKTVMQMSILNKNMSVKITASGLLRWEACEVNVAPRSFNTLVYRLKGSGTLSGKDFSIESNPGDVFFMPKDTPYFAKYHSYNEVLFINFYSDIECFT